MKTWIVLSFCLALAVSAQARMEPTPPSQQMARKYAPLKAMPLPDGTVAQVTARTAAARTDPNFSASKFPAGYWQKAARTNSAVLATQVFPSGLVMTTRVFTNQTANALIHSAPRTSPTAILPVVQPYCWQFFWVYPDPPFPSTFASDWQGFASGTFSFQVLADLGSHDWRTLGTFTIDDPNPDPTFSYGFDCPVGPPQNFLPLSGGYVRIMKAP